MIEMVLLLAMIALIIWAFSTNLVFGFIALCIVALYYYFRRYANLCFMMALSCYNRQDVNGCFRWFARAEKRGMTINQKITYAYYLMREGRVERSETILNSILAFSRKPAEKYPAKQNHAVLLLKTGRLNEALEELEDIFPHYKNSTVYGSLGHLYILMGNMEKAESFNREAYSYNSTDAVILDNMVHLYNKLEDYETAYQYAGELLEQNPAFIEAYYHAAIAEKGLGKTEEAKAHLEHALTIRTTFISSVTHEDVERLLKELA